MPWAAISAGLGIINGINTLTNSGGSGGGGTTQAADPFAAYRGNLASLYSGALTQGATTDPTKMPGYSQYKSGVMDPALDATKRSMAASGQMQSGNEQIALQNTAQQGYYGFMTDYMNRLAQGSGAANNPAQAVGLGLQQQQAGYTALGQGIGAMGTALNANQNPNYNFNIPTSTISGTAGAGDTLYDTGVSQGWM